jgi:hypothetical protein
MNDVVVLPQSNRDRAAAALERIQRLTPNGGASNAAGSIAATLAASVREAITGATPYGRPIDIEMDVAHQDASGSTTSARLRLKCGGSNR